MLSATAVIVQRARFGTPSGDPSFLSMQFTDIVAFTTLVSAAVLWRKQPSAHKRLMLLATVYLNPLWKGFAVKLLGH
jgi:hypothetical protein